MMRVKINNFNFNQIAGGKLPGLFSRSFYEPVVAEQNEYLVGVNQTSGHESFFGEWYHHLGQSWLINTNGYNNHGNNKQVWYSNGKNMSIWVVYLCIIFESMNSIFALPGWRHKCILKKEGSIYRYWYCFLTITSIKAINCISHLFSFSFIPR